MTREVRMKQDARMITREMQWRWLPTNEKEIAQDALDKITEEG